MPRFFAYLLSLFRFGRPPEEDHLTGAIDLSDAPYCLGLLPTEQEP